MDPHQGHAVPAIATQMGLVVLRAVSLAVSPIVVAMMRIPFVTQELLANVTPSLTQPVTQTSIHFVMAFHLRRHSQADLVNVGHLLAPDQTRNALEHLELV